MTPEERAEGMWQFFCDRFAFLTPEEDSLVGAAVDGIALAIRAAVEEEREACAKLAQDRSGGCGKARCLCGNGHHIAAAIRARGTS